ncbi:hypothetical protein BFG57_01875 [Bacillus solimangrovi]|uniref:histidine kinase n=2 Tax=Bacillus solimangrovi TaxID=1305675 RepID=A0A1E5LFK8_9BACI|nr:hypothetical protein BFG57_01875 [Bacillus solimangrovi]
MKLRTILITSNILSISIIIIFLVISYVNMSIPNDTIILLSIITVIAGVVSLVSHMVLTQPLLNGVKQLTRESKRIANGQFDVTVSQTGPKEFRELATDFNDMSKKLNESFIKLKKSEEFKRELIANISHDLKTPISSIQSFVEALQDDIIESKETRQTYLKTIRNETERLSLLITELLEFSKLEDDNIPFQPVQTHVDQVIIETLENFELKLHEKAINLHVQIDDSLPSIKMVSNEIKRVLTNLIDNAVRYSPENSMITVEVEKDEMKVTFKITDEGPGIEEQYLEDVFERFFRVEKSRNKKYGGAGLGLAISKEIIERHGGQIGVTVEDDSGCTFWFTLPI